MRNDQWHRQTTSWSIRSLSSLDRMSSESFDSFSTVTAVWRSNFGFLISIFFTINTSLDRNWSRSRRNKNCFSNVSDPFRCFHSFLCETCQIFSCCTLPYWHRWIVDYEQRQPRSQLFSLIYRQNYLNPSTFPHQHWNQWNLYAINVLFLIKRSINHPFHCSNNKTFVSNQAFMNNATFDSSSFKWTIFREPFKNYRITPSSSHYLSSDKLCASYGTVNGLYWHYDDRIGQLKLPKLNGLVNHFDSIFPSNFAHRKYFNFVIRIFNMIVQFLLMTLMQRSILLIIYHHMFQQETFFIVAWRNEISSH